MKLKIFFVQFIVIFFVLSGSFNVVGQANAGLDLTGCTDNYSLAAWNPFPGTGAWTVVTGSVTILSPTLYNTSIVAGPGENILRWTVDIGGNISFDEVIITNNNPTDPVATTPIPYTCDGTAIINGNTPISGIGQWSILGGGGVISNQDLPSATVNYLSQGFNTFRWTISKNGCSEFAGVDIINRAVSTNAGADIDNVCGVEPAISSVYLNAVAPNTFLGESGSWSVVGGTGMVSNPTLFNTQVSGMSNGINTFRWIVTNGYCSASDNVSVIVSIPSTAVTIPDYETCADLTDSRTLIANNPISGIGTWTLVLGSGAVTNPNNANTTVTNLGLGQNRFRWSINYNGCVSVDDLSITNNFVMANAGSDQAICSDYINLSANDPSLSQGTGIWSSTTPGVIISNNTSANTSVSNLTFGNNNFQWIVSNNGCTDVDEVIVTSNFPRNVTAGTDQQICSGTTNLAGSNPGMGTGKWTIIGGSGMIANPTMNQTEVSGLGSGPNIFQWTVTVSLCSSSANVIIINNSVNAAVQEHIMACNPEHSATLVANSPHFEEIGNWSKISAGPGIITNISTNVTTVTGLGNGDTFFRWTVSNAVCSNSADLKVTDNYYNTTASAAGPTTLCVNYSPILGGSLPVGAAGLWTSTAADVTFDNPSLVATIARNLPGGTSAITWTVTKDGCSSPASFDLLNNAVYANAGADQAICSNQTSVSAQPLNPAWGAIGIWTSIAGGGIFVNPTSASTLVSGLSAGDNLLRWTVTKGLCVASDDVKITNNTVMPLAGADEVTCNNFATLSATPLSPTGSGNWIGGGVSTTIDNANSPTTNVRNLQQGVNTFTWTVTDKGCTGSSSVQITSNFFLARAGNDQNLRTDYTSMSASLPSVNSVGTWQVIEGAGMFSDINDSKSQVTNLGLGFNTFRWNVDWNNCNAFDEVNIIYNHLHAVAGADQNSCSETVFLNADDAYPGTGTWSVVSGEGIFVNPLSKNTEVTGILPGSVNIFRWTVSLNGFAEFDDVTIINTKPVVDAGPDAQIIDISEYALSASPSSEGNWSCSAQEVVFNNRSLSNAIASNIQHGSTTFTWTVTNQCGSFSDDLVISRIISVSISGQPISKEIKEGNEAVFSVIANGDITEYQWRKDGVNLTDNQRIKGSSTPDLNISNVTLADAGNYDCEITGLSNTIQSNLVILSVLTDIEKLNIYGIKLYPNPSEGKFNIEFGTLVGFKEMIIHNLGGQKVLQKTISNSIERIDLSELGDAIYIISIHRNNEIIQSKIIVRK